MAHFAKLNESNVVIEVHVIHNNELIDENGQESEAKGIEFLTEWSGGYTNWKQTSYNGNFRKNYAGVGFVFDAGRDAFIPPKPFASWVLNENSCIWDAPVAKPEDDKRYFWDENTTSWIEIVA